MYVQVATSHSDPEVTHRQSSPDESYDQSPRGGRGGEDEMSDIYRVYGVTARNAHKECLVCSMEVCTYVWLQVLCGCEPCPSASTFSGSKTHITNSMAMYVYKQ